ncbi:MAG: Acylphosphatase [Candidatus Methanofastidiosum methylothiophilum]|uniref:acylphosphatase n=1 Tax=Candidatus Methanofastidiosum methylothiophilum TaxID=1705564 RepID=A0A150IYR1_9EURY|nr:MAG: Acylphosphatase [Candidatus Methanofastidiosum methylthiophilus]KYC47670.1 MAG: Acylphosphatase [Candidatus Methanofastidiosum methylthiophilus]KYC50131.1 MAG: Acylphosphatase [Candidatus Methanofastidiosum methylthiophilus]
MKRVRIYVSGLVQGVFYRANAQKEAQRLRVTGYVKNLHDGRVEAVIEGEDICVNKMIQWCEVGPKYARVDKVELINEHYNGEFKDFSIK